MYTTWNLTGIILLSVDWILRIVFLIYIPRNRKPSSAMAWLLAIYAIPIVGVLLFLLIGSPKLSQRRRRRQKAIDYLLESTTKLSGSALDDLRSQDKERYGALIAQNTELGKMPARYGNKFTVIDEYKAIIDSMIVDIQAAKKHIYVESYALTLDATTKPFFAALEQATARGVRVYVLFDAIGTQRSKGHRQMKKELTRIGASWHAILPISLRPGQYNRPDLRNHRKITVIDTTIAYIGSLNLIDRTYHRKDDIVYDELTVRVVGPAARQAGAVVAGDWISETDEAPENTLRQPLPRNSKKGALAQILPSGPAYDYENNLQLFTSLLYAAKKSIVITNPYFVPDEALLHAVISATKRGVEVTIINSEAQDQWMVGHAQRSYYQQLLEAGVTIYLHRAPVLLHSKHITIDDDIAVVGSSNMDMRSFQLNLECVVVIYDRKVVESLQKIQLKNIAHSHRVSLHAWMKRSVAKQFLDSITRLTSALQ